ncbi:uncharacterized protein [Rutidosis leptorrhynchoides]|uniref:uncharacterized protein n=1 Tax=Rutidosis leptorrhynchoides TaxID=125765 RepID=UPI003A98CE70
MDNLDIPFTSSFTKVISQGNDTLFWKDAWFNNSPLCLKYGRLYRLESNQNATLDSRLVKDGSGWIANWEWVRHPMGRTKDELDDMITYLNSFKYSAAQGDSWRWKLVNFGVFNCSDLGSMLNSKILQPNPTLKETVRNNLVPQKLSIFVWRCKMGRLPVLKELDKRGIDLNSVRCPICDKDVESINHTFLECTFVKDIWFRVHKWWNSSCSIGTNLDDLFSGKSNGSQSNDISVLWQAIVWTCGYIIWKNRNNTIFHNKKGNGPTILNEIQLKSFEWISRRSKKSSLDWNQWLLNPSTFDDHG